MATTNLEIDQLLLYTFIYFYQNLSIFVPPALEILEALRTFPYEREQCKQNQTNQHRSKHSQTDSRELLLPSVAQLRVPFPSLLVLWPTADEETS